MVRLHVHSCLTTGLQSDAESTFDVSHIRHIVTDCLGTRLLLDAECLCDVSDMELGALGRWQQRPTTMSVVSGWPTMPGLEVRTSRCFV